VESRRHTGRRLPTWCRSGGWKVPYYADAEVVYTFCAGDLAQQHLGEMTSPAPHPISQCAHSHCSLFVQLTLRGRNQRDTSLALPRDPSSKRHACVLRGSCPTCLITLSDTKGACCVEHHDYLLTLKQAQLVPSRVHSHEHISSDQHLPPSIA
jgi:hypothetical protein